MNENTLDIKTAGELMKIHPKTVLDLINKGDLPAGKIGRAYVLLKRDVMNYVENLIIKQTAERMGVPLRRASPHATGKVTAAQVRISA